MARLTEDEKQELLRSVALPTPGVPGTDRRVHEPTPRKLTTREYIEFATFASGFDRSRKPAAYGGDQWKL